MKSTRKKLSSAYNLSQSEPWVDFRPGICLPGCCLIFLQLRLGFPLPGKRHGWASTKHFEPTCSPSHFQMFQTLFSLPLVFTSETRKGMVEDCLLHFLAQLPLELCFCQRWNILYFGGLCFPQFRSSRISIFKASLWSIRKYPIRSQSCTGGCTDEQAQQCRFQWQQQHQPMYDFPPVNNRHPCTILEPQSHFCHGNPLPLSCRPPHHNLHGHPHTFPSGQSDFEQSCAKNWTRETNNVGVQMTLSLVCLVITNPQVILSLLVMKVSMVQICKWWWTSRDVGTQILGDFL